MIDDVNLAPNGRFSLSYTFNFREVKLLARFLRKNQEKLPEGLDHFEQAIQDAVYSELSLDEIKDFYEN